MSKKRVFLISLFVLLSTQLWAKDPIAWTLNQNFPNPITVNTGSYSVQYTFRNQLPFTLVHPIKILKTASSSEFSFTDLCTGKKLAPNETCTVDVFLEPSSLGLKTLTLTIECYDKNQVILSTLTTTTISSTAPAIFTVGGQTHGLTLGKTLIIQNNGGDNLSITNDIPFTFSNPLPNGSTYEVTIFSQPTNLECTVNPDTRSGTINNANVTNVTIICAPLSQTFTVSGTLQGYASFDPVVLQLNGGSDLPLTTNGSFTFPTTIAQSADYNVTRFNNPTGQDCTVSNGSGTNVTANVTNVLVTCSSNTYRIEGIVTGLLAPAQITLETNGMSLPVIGTETGGSLFRFPLAIADGSQYNVVVTSQPDNLNCKPVINGSGTVSGSNVTNVAVNCVPVVTPTTLSITPSNLALSVTGRTEYGVPILPNPIPPIPPIESGVARVLTVTNTGAFTANNLIIETEGLPVTTNITSIPSTCGATLNAGASCTITVKPGVDASTTDGVNSCNKGTGPMPGTIFISGDNASAVSSSITVLDYGCIYQNGYVYAFNDSNTAGSVKGKVATATNQSNESIWSSNSDGTYDGGTEIYGTSEISTTGSPHPTNPPVLNPCNGSTDGSCDTGNIYTYYQTFATGHPINLSFYAAGLCKQTISGSSDWYLPAICEMAYGNLAAPFCGNQATPALQNMLSNLVEFNSLSLLSGTYWSSTTHAGSTIQQAWSPTFPNGNITFSFKGISLGVRCSRLF